MPKSILRETLVIIIATAVFIAVAAVFGLPGKPLNSGTAEAAISFEESLSPSVRIGAPERARSTGDSNPETGSAMATSAWQ